MRGGRQEPPPEVNNDLDLLWSAVHALYAFNLGGCRRRMTFYSLLWEGGKKKWPVNFLKSFRASLIKLQNSKHYVPVIASGWPERGCQPIIVLRVGAIVLAPPEGGYSNSHEEVLFRRELTPAPH